MPKIPFNGRFPKGSAVWNLISRSRDAWRIGTVIGVGDTIYSTHIQVLQPGTKIARFVYDYYARCEVIPRVAIPHVPNGTIYLVNTKIGTMLSQRLGVNGAFEVYECSTRVMTTGQLLGYIVLPCFIERTQDWYEHPAYKTWSVEPNVFELLSFLGSKLPEIIAVHKALTGQVPVNGQEAVIQSNNVQTA